MVIARALHEEVVAILRREICSLSPGSRIDTEPVLAKRFTVSVGTIRQAVLCLVQEGLLHRRQGSGTYVADASKTMPVGILIAKNLANPSLSPFYLRFVGSLQAIFAREGVETRLYFDDEAQPDRGLDVCLRAAKDAAAGKLCGLVVSAVPRDASWAAPLAEAKFPLVGSDDAFPVRVVTDAGDMTKEAVARLASFGRKRLAFIGYGDGVKAFSREAEKRGCVCRPEWMVTDLHPERPGAGYEAVCRIWNAGDKPDGLFVADDVLFRTAVTALVEKRLRIPEALLVLAHANRGAEVFAPFPVNRLVVDAQAAANESARALLAQVRREAPPPPEIRIPVRYEESAAPAAIGGPS